MESKINRYVGKVIVVFVFHRRSHVMRQCWTLLMLFMDFRGRGRVNSAENREFPLPDRAEEVQGIDHSIPLNLTVQNL